MKNYTFIELSNNQYFEKIEVVAKNIKEAKTKLIALASEVLFYRIEFSSKKVDELFTLI